MFQEPIPGFNIAGKTGVSTLLGSLCSLALIIIMTLYGLVKIDTLVNKLNPALTRIEEEHEKDENTLVNLRDDANMPFAFSVMDTKSKTTRLDPRYVKIITRVVHKSFNGTDTEHVVDHHPCTDDDWAQFAPPDEEAEDLLRKIKENSKNTFLCLDWKRDGNELNIGGSGGGVQQL